MPNGSRGASGRTSLSRSVTGAAGAPSLIRTARNSTRAASLAQAGAKTDRFVEAPAVPSGGGCRPRPGPGTALHPGWLSFIAAGRGMPWWQRVAVGCRSQAKSGERSSAERSATTGRQRVRSAGRLIPFACHPVPASRGVGVNVNPRGWAGTRRAAELRGTRYAGHARSRRLALSAFCGWMLYPPGRRASWPTSPQWRPAPGGSSAAARPCRQPSPARPAVSSGSGHARVDGPAPATP